MKSDRDRDENFEAPEESEYHFSDEEVSYEVEPESPKPTPPTAEPPSAGGNVFTRLTRSKRMAISLVVFLVLVFIVYKVIAPTTTPVTEITPAVTTAQTKPMAPTAPSRPQPTSNVEYAPQNPIVQPAQMPPPAQPEVVRPPQPVVSAPPPTVTTPVQPVVAAQPTMPVAPVNVPQPQPSLPSTPTAPNVMPVVGTAPTVQQVPPTLPVTQQPTPIVSPPTEIPIQPTVSVSASPSLGTQLPPDANVRIAAMSQENQKSIQQLQADYTQKINDFMTQNKSLQDQVQLLSTRVASVETEMNRLVQTLTRQTAINNMKANAPPPPPAHIEGPPPRIPFTVQAIIPGRAWLKADSGETLTVTEGDIIKGLGKVSKIDPYDGIIEINTGGRILSLSYGNGG